MVTCVISPVYYQNQAGGVPGSQPPLPTAAAPPPKRERKAITIVDPNTGKDVIFDTDSASSSHSTTSASLPDEVQVYLLHG